MPALTCRHPDIGEVRDGIVCHNCGFWVALKLDPKTHIPLCEFVT